MPSPQRGESRSDFMERCVPQVLDEGTADNQEQAVAICESYWQEGEAAMNQEIIGKSMGWQKFQGQDGKRVAFPLRTKDVKETDQGDITFTGQASVFDVLDSDRDIIAPGAFSDSLEQWNDKGRTPPMLWQHDWHQPVGKYDKIEETEKALEVEGRLFAKDISKAREAGRLIKEGAIDGLSIGFFPGGPVTVDDENNVRTFHKLDLWEVSIVTFPALDQARIDATKAITSGVIPEFNSLAEIERFLRDCGFSKRAATALCSHIKRLSESGSQPQGDLAAISKGLDELTSMIRR